MVLQKAPQRAVLWGYATTIGDSVSVALNGSIVANARVTNNTEGAGGIWMTKLPAQNAGGPYTIAVTSQDGHVTLTDVMFGDVWVCSGQSNMAFTMARVSFKYVCSSSSFSSAFPTGVYYQIVCSLSSSRDFP